MNAIGVWLRRVWYLLNRRRFDDALILEMNAHRSMMSDPARFGNSLRLRERSREVWGWTWLDDVARDVRFAARTLRRAPGVTLVAITSLALATGATTAIFSVVNSVLLRPLPFARPNELVQVHGRNWAEDRGGPDSLTGPVGMPELEAYATQSTLVRAFAGYDLTTKHLDGPSGPERVRAVGTEGGFFALLGVPALVGRTFRADDPQNVAVISDRLWESRFSRDPSLPGKTIVLDGQPYTVLGVMPDEFQFPYGAASLMPAALPESRTDLWIPVPPLRPSGGGPLRRGRLRVIARLAPNATIDAAESELRVIAKRVEEQQTQPNRRIGVRLEPLADVVVGQVRRSLWMLFAAVGLVLAAACANVANLLLARMTVRAREVVTRAALGADRWRLARQFLAESLLLALGGGVLGVAIAYWGSRLLVVVGSAKIPRAHEIALDWRAFAFLLVVCVATAVLFGLAPAVVAARVDVQTALKETGGHGATTRGYGRIRDGLVVLEVTLAFVLAVGAALVMRELGRLQRADAGMVTDDVLALHVTPRTSAQDYYAIEDRVAQLRGVKAAGFIQLVPLQNWGWEADVTITGRPRDPTSPRTVAGLRYVTPGYFRALAIQIAEGRGFTPGDDAAAPHVIIVNQAFARRYLPGESAVGRITDRGVIVGVIGDVRNAGLNRPVDPELYYPAAQNVTMASDIGMSLLVRTEGAPERLVASIRSAVRDVNPSLAIFNVKPMRQVVADSLWELNLYRWLVGLFALLSVVLAAIGLYGVISYNATSRVREFAVRLALGAAPGNLTRLVLGRALRLAVAGLAVGVVTAMALTPLVRALPIGIHAEPGTYVMIAALLVAIAALACVVPAIRVARVNPASALRHD
jgi:predicted permease